MKATLLFLCAIWSIETWVNGTKAGASSASACNPHTLGITARNVLKPLYHSYDQ